MPVIAVTNYKGGVGKTTSSLNLAAALREQGKRVLIVDFDPQANLTIYAGVKDPEELPKTLSEVMREYVREQYDPAIAIGQILLSLPNGLDLLPCNHHLVQVEQELTRMDDRRRERVLKTIVSELRDQYDFIIIDCLPSAGMLSTNALTAADYVLVPVQAEYLALQGLAYILQYIAQTRATCNPRLQILGVLMTMVDLRTLHSREVLQAVRNVFQSRIRVFYSMVKVDVKLRESSKAGQTILDYAPSSRGAEAYRSLAKEILAIIPDYEEDPERGTFNDPELVEEVAETASTLELKELAGHGVPLPAEKPRAEGSPGFTDAPAATVAAVPVVCPKLGFAAQLDQHALEPHPDHMCFATSEPLNLSINRQQKFCLTQDYKLCPLYIRYSVTAGEDSRRRQKESTSGNLLKQRLFGAFKLFSR